MTKKQNIGLIIAALVFVFVSAASMLTNRIISNFNLFDDLTTSSGSYYPASRDYNYVGVINVNGTIMEGDSFSFFNTETYNHAQTLECIDEMIIADNNSGILLKIDSPGGTVYHSDELYLKLMEYRETGRPIYVYMESMAASGGYYIAMASDGLVYANRNTTTGSIGVIMSLTNYKELFDKLGIKEINITSGKHKDMGSSGLDMTDEQEAILQSIIDESYDQFADIVALGRNMDINEVKRIADGRILTAKQAEAAGLIDGVMPYQELTDLILDNLGRGFTVILEPEVHTSVWNSFFFAAKEIQPKSDLQIMQEMIDKTGSGVPMYYAYDL